MLRLIGAIVVVLLLVGPLMAQAGLLDQAGPLRDLVDMEVHVFRTLIVAAQNLWHRFGGPSGA